MSRPVILLVDDESDLLQVIAMAVGRALPSYEIMSAGSLAEAEGCLRDIEQGERPLALAMVDHTLGGAGTGMSLLAAIRERFPRAATFLFTGKAADTVEDDARATNTRVLWKPLRLATLLGEVTGALNEAA